MKYQAEALSTFPGQIRFALNQYTLAGFDRHSVQNIILCGMGGSGIAGRIVQTYFSRIYPIPVEVVSGYDLPAYIGTSSLLVFNSYSGNTEETISQFRLALNTGCRMISITSGGELASLSEQLGIKIYPSEKGYQPRMALGYSLTYLFLLFYEIAGLEFKDELALISRELEDRKRYIDASENILKCFSGRLGRDFVIIADQKNSAVALRFAQQLQENAKTGAFILELPEMNHNVIESYYTAKEYNFLLMNSQSNERNNLRFQFLENLLKENGYYFLRMDQSINNPSDLYKLIYTFDWLSLMVADKLNIKSDEIAHINKLKEFLKKH